MAAVTEAVADTPLSLLGDQNTILVKAQEDRF